MEFQVSSWTLGKIYVLKTTFLSISESNLLQEVFISMQVGAPRSQGAEPPLTFSMK